MKRVLIIAIILLSIYFIAKPKLTTYKKSSPVKLMGITWKEGEGVAVINGRVLKEGESIVGYRVVRIEKDSVLLSYDNQNFKLTFAGLTSPYDIKDTIKRWFKDIVEGFKER